MLPILVSQIILSLSGLTFDSCIRNVSNILKDNDYVTNVIRVELNLTQIEVDNKAQNFLDSIIEDINDIGYEVKIS